MAEASRPVGNKGDRCRVLFCAGNAIDEEAQAITGNIVRVTAKGPDLMLEEGSDCVYLEGGSLRLDLCSHERDVVEAYIEEFRSIAAPHREETSVGRDLPFTSWARKWSHINFKFARLIRRIGNPSTVRRELCAVLLKVRREKRKGLSVSQ